MKNKILDCGDTLPHVVSADITAGTALLIGVQVGVAVNDYANGEEGMFDLEGVFMLPKASGAMSKGAKLYWDNTAKNITTTSSGNTACGMAWKDALSGDTEVAIKLIPNS